MVEVLEDGAGARGDGHGVAVDRDDAGETTGREHRVHGCADGGEAVAGADHLEPGAGLPSGTNLRGDGLRVLGLDHPGRGGGLEPRPVLPGRHGIVSGIVSGTGNDAGSAATRSSASRVCMTATVWANVSR